MIRRARLDDLSALPAVESSAATAYRAIPDRAWLADGEAISHAEHIALRERGITLIAEGDGGICGFICSEPLGESLFIREVSVRHQDQGKGIGHGLLRALIDQARAAGWTRITLTTFRDLAWNAPFYARLGFRELQADALAPELRLHLQREIEHGLPAEHRCAMALDI